MRDGIFGWDYPPGVTGNEPEITGIWYCPSCDALTEEPCEDCGDCEICCECNDNASRPHMGGDLGRP